MDALTILAILFGLQCQVYSEMITKNNMSCSGITINNKYLQNGRTIGSMLLRKPTKGNSSNICQINWTCCSKKLEDELYNVSSRLLKDSLHSNTNATRIFFESQASLFDAFFKDLLKRAKIEWHGMLLTTYQDKYTANRQIFDDFFSNLGKYYGKENVNLTDATDVFFKKLFGKILVLTQPNLKGQQHFLECVTKNIYKIKPFGNIPARISSQLSTSLHIARTFTDDLAVASDVIRTLTYELPTRNCLKRFTRIQDCSVCAGLPNALVCKKSCENVAQTCFPSAPEVHRKWNDFVRQLQLISKAMGGVYSRYNIEAVGGQLFYDISMAIMGLQTNLVTVMTKSKTLCKLSGKTKRAALSGNDFYLEGDRRHKRSGSSLPKHFSIGPKKSPGKKRNVTLNSLTVNFRKQLSGTKDVWINLPNQICNDQRFASQDHAASCWNGIGLQKNVESVPIIKSSNVTDSKAIIESQLQLLTFTTSKNKHALYGKLLARDDNEDDDDDDTTSTATTGSGGDDNSGSGDYSGDDSPTLKPTEDDNQSGSGSPTTGTRPTDDEEGDTQSGSGGLTPTTTMTKPTTDDEDGEESGSGSGAGNEIPEKSTKTTKTDGNGVDDLPPTRDPGGVLAKKVLLATGFTPTSGGCFSTSLPLITSLCLLISTFLHIMLE